VERFEQVLSEEMTALRDELGESFEAGKFDEAKALFRELCVQDQFTEFLTLPAYEQITSA
jgi:malate synthase